MDRLARPDTLGSKVTIARMRARDALYALTAEHTAAYFDLRRGALETDPLAFAIPVESDWGLSSGAVESALAELPREAPPSILGAFAVSLVGVVGVLREPEARNRARIWGFYVTPEIRRRGIGQSLLSAAYDLARRVSGVDQLVARVPATSAACIRLLEHFGFEGGALDREGSDESSPQWLSMTLNLPDEAA